MTETVGDALSRLARRFAEAGIDNARLDARVLVAEALGIDTTTVFARPERPLDESAARQLESMATRRANREPIARILERREFWSLTFSISADTLIPRPDSETLIEAALEGISDRRASLRVLDLGTGSGCLLLALLSELPQATGLGVDLSEDALTTARENARGLGLEDRTHFACAGWDAGNTGPYDIILANPPYIPSADIPGLMPEVARFEPQGALDGGPDGLDSYRAIAASLPHLLAPRGAAYLEVGDGQAPEVAALLTRSGLQDIEIKKDLAGIGRCVAVRHLP